MSNERPKIAKAVPLPPLLFPPRERSQRAWLARLKAEGRVRSIGPRLYASVAPRQVEATVRASWSSIASTLFEGTLVSHRSALEFMPTPSTGEIFLTSSTNRVVRYPGLSLRFLRGPEALPDDSNFLALRASSRPRAFLENLSRTRRGGPPKNLSREALEAALEQLLTDGGEAALNALRERAREISLLLGWKREFGALDGLVGALLSSRPVGALASERARARALGEPFDTPCLERLQLLFAELQRRALPQLEDLSSSPDHFSNKAFFEAYFSNYIEGTRFEIDEAEDIVFNKRVPGRRPKDAHDILQTYRLVSDPNQQRVVPKTFDEFIELLLERHRALLAQRPEAEPGVFKARTNRAGDTSFVRPEAVRGTLRKGFELYQGLPAGFSRATFMMFLVTDVHPFVDGNGRVARVMMNAELLAQGASTIIIPNVYREDYLLTLRALSRRHRPAPLVDMLHRAQRFSRLDFSNYPRVLADLERRNWFREPDAAKLLDG